MPIVMLTLAQPDAAKVEPHRRQTQRRERLHRVIHHLVVHRAATPGVRVAEECGVSRVRPPGVQHRLQLPGRSTQAFDRADTRKILYCIAHVIQCIGQIRLVFLGPGHGLPTTLPYPVIMAIDPIALTRQLVDIESTTYHEGRAGAFLHEFLIAQSYAVERMEVPQPDNSTPGCGHDERFNLYAALPGVTPDVVLSTHMDTVPPFFGCTEDDQFLYGRGACDAKGIIAAQVAAADRLRDSGVKVGLLFLVGEERDSAGAKVANQMPRGSRFLINGEPTDNCLALASKGALRVEIRARGRMAHSAYPELGESAIDKLVAALNDVLAMPLPVEPEIGSSTLNIGLIQGGRAPNVIADQAEAHLLIRLVGPSEQIREAILATVGDRADVAFSLDLPFVRMRRVGDLPTMIAKFTTDIPSLTAWGEPFLLGPGSIHVAHTPNEKIAKKELLEAVDLYVDLATSLAH
jgi:acetylornithine deacetylase